MKGNDHGKKMDLVGVCGMTVCIIYMYMIDAIQTILTHESFTCRIWLQERYVYVWRRLASAMRGGPDKGRDKEEEEDSESSYTEVEEEVEKSRVPPLLPSAKAKGVAKKAAARPPEVGISSSESVSPAPTRPRGSGGHFRPKSPPSPRTRGKERELTRGRSPAPSACGRGAAKSVRNPSSSETDPGEDSKKGAKGGKKGKKGFQRCRICWTKVSTGESCMKQHQRWNANCIAWGYHNQGMPWDQAQQKAQRKKQRREEQAAAGMQEEAAASRPSPEKVPPEKKKERKSKVKKRRVSPSPEARAPDRKRYKKDPDNSSDDERLPKVRSKGKEIIIRLPRAR